MYRLNGIPKRTPTSGQLQDIRKAKDREAHHFRRIGSKVQQRTLIAEYVDLVQLPIDEAIRHAPRAPFAATILELLERDLDPELFSYLTPRLSG